MSDRHSALVAQRTAEKTFLRRSAADAKFQSRVNTANQAAQQALEASMARIFNAGKQRFTHGRQYHSSPFSSYNTETNIETSALEELPEHRKARDHPSTSTSTSTSTPLTIDLLHPAPKIIDKLVPIEHWLARQTPTTSFVVEINPEDGQEIKIPTLERDVPLVEVLKLDQRQKYLKVLRRKGERVNSRSKEKFQHQQSSGLRKGSLVSFDSTQHAKLLRSKNKKQKQEEQAEGKTVHGIHTHYFGADARKKYFVDLKSYIKSDFDHQLGSTRKERQRCQKQTVQQEKQLHLTLMNTSGKTIHRRTSAAADQDIIEADEERDEKKEDAAIAKAPSSNTAITGNINKWQERRKRALDSSGHGNRTTTATATATTTTRRATFLDELHENNWSEYISDQAAINCDETVVLTKKSQHRLENAATTSLNRVEFRQHDPRHTLMKTMIVNGMLPEPLLIGKKRKIQHTNQHVQQPAALGGSSNAPASLLPAGGEDHADGLEKDVTLNLTHYKLGNERMVALAPSLVSVLDGTQLESTTMGNMIWYICFAHTCVNSFS